MPMKPELVTSNEPEAVDRPAPASAALVPVIRMPVDARGLALAILAAIAIVFALQWAQAFVVSLLVGILIAYMLNPLVSWLERIKLPRVVASLVVVLGVVCALVLGAYSLRGQVQTII